MLNAAINPNPANDNTPPLRAKFVYLPDSFLLFYEEPIKNWAPQFRHGSELTINLLNPPNTTVISSGWQGHVVLRCEIYNHPVTKKAEVIVGPATPADGERIARHMEALPGILTALKAADQAKRASRPKMARWVFDDTVPEYFVLRYQFELREWARNLSKIGTTKHIVLREGALAAVSPDPEQGAELIRVELHCKAERLSGDELQIVVYADERNEWLMRRHCEKMQGAGIPPGAVLVEPDRPGLPMFPTVTPIAGPPVGASE